MGFPAPRNNNQVRRAMYFVVCSACRQKQMSCPTSVNSLLVGEISSPRKSTRRPMTCSTEDRRRLRFSRSKVCRSTSCRPEMITVLHQRPVISHGYLTRQDSVPNSNEKSAYTAVIEHGKTSIKYAVTTRHGTDFRECLS